MNFSAEDFAQAQRMMQGMNPGDLQGMMRAFQNNPALQQTMVRNLGGEGARRAAGKEEGNRLFGQGSFAEAGAAYLRAIRGLEAADGADAERGTLLRQCRNNYALCQLRLGDWSEARGAAERVLRAEPGDVKANWYLIEALAGEGSLARARELFARTAHLFPDKPELAELRRRLAEGAEVSAPPSESPAPNPPAVEEPLLAPPPPAAAEPLPPSVEAPQDTDRICADYDPGYYAELLADPPVAKPEAEGQRKVCGESLLNKYWQVLLGVLIGLLVARLIRR